MKAADASASARQAIPRPPPSARRETQPPRPARSQTPQVGSGEENNAFGRCALTCYFQNMSQLATADRQQLRALLHKQLDHCSDAELEAVRKALLQLEAERLLADIGAAAQADWDAGKYDPALVEGAIREHRARHPYR